MSESSVPLRIVIVGAGKIAVDHLVAIDACPHAELVGIVDSNLGAARALAGARAVPIGERLAEVVESAAAEAVVIATPTASHVPLASEALERGLHVLVEKPIATSRAALSHLVGTAIERGRVLVSGQVVRFLPTVAAAREVLTAEALGPIEQIVERRVEHRSGPAPWWFDTDDFLLHHWGSHSIDLVLHLFGVQLERVLCRGGAMVEGFDGLDSVTLLGELVGGGRLSLHHSFSSRIPRHDLLVIGRHATLEFSGYREVRLDGEVLFAAEESSVIAAGFDAQLADFVAAVRGGRTPLADASTLDGCLAVLEAAARSLRSGAVEPLL